MTGTFPRRGSLRRKALLFLAESGGDGLCPSTIATHLGRTRLQAGGILAALRTAGWVEDLHPLTGIRWRVRGRMLREVRKVLAEEWRAKVITQRAGWEAR